MATHTATATIEVLDINTATVQEARDFINGLSWMVTQNSDSGTLFFQHTGEDTAFARGMLMPRGSSYNVLIKTNGMELRKSSRKRVEELYNIQF